MAERVAHEIARLLGDDLVGVYLHGSLAMRCFNPARSDVDLLVVTRRRMDAGRRRALAELVLAHSRVPYPLEMSVVTRADLHPWRHPAPFDFHYSETWRDALERAVAAGGPAAEDRHDRDLAAHVTLARARGSVLVGEPTADALPPVPEADYLDAVRSDLDWSRHAPGVYGVLNSCRALAFVHGRGLLSKAEAADWAIDALPAAHRPLIAAARAAYRTGAEEPCDAAAVRRFTDWAAAQIGA
jgi:streptomycin 3"-adenylyltransferase